MKEGIDFKKNEDGLFEEEEVGGGDAGDGRS